MKRALLCATLAMAAGLAQAGEADAKAQIKDALMAGPAAITGDATIMAWSGEVLRQGHNGWVCYPGPHVNGKSSMCLDGLWQRWAKAWMGKTDFKPDAMGMAYMLAGDEGSSNTDPFAESATADNQWVVEGPHLMILVPDPALLEGISTDPNQGGPYVMWKGTPYAHIMVPVGPR
ncbi:hypothetical protein [Gallaecimonas xiamenensis]|uniref:Uncharacterized protein n=1 Tax=Gallaecimonas xiamenensis 3-C-1 TaxID=745411 RepID=K2J4I6_9GAMM|nr:hypothetical protein [Gallaecimonas xiamenensis]EKE77951.1 hypothetical protein B3C1_00785 [Gallaecimonas xiamenensis 3-C-1]